MKNGFLLRYRYELRNQLDRTVKLDLELSYFISNVKRKRVFYDERRVSFNKLTVPKKSLSFF